jgi:hypothetical protein
MASRALLLCACAVFAACGSALAQTAVPLIEPNPVFTPGLYERKPQLGVPEPAGEEPDLHYVSRLWRLPRRDNGTVP